MQRLARILLLLVVVCLCRTLAAAAPRVFHEGRFEKAELKYIDDVPVLLVAGAGGDRPAEGRPDERGGQGDRGVSRALLRLFHAESRWEKCVSAGTAMMEHAPADYRAELQAFCKAANLDPEAGVVANTLPDTYRGWLGCSSLMVLPEKSATKGTLFGRNLDFYAIASLDKCGLVTVYRPKGKRAFASIGFPGLMGCLSGINDAGLAVAVHEVFFSGDGATMLNTKAMPYAACFRRVLEECDSVATAEKLVRSVERSTLLNLAVCDRRDCAVLEMTPKTVAIRRGAGGVCVCTNHFRTEELALFSWCRRYPVLCTITKIEKIGVRDVAQKLDAVNQGRLTMQTMIFEPGPLLLHVSLGPPPASKQPLREISLAPLLKGKKGLGIRD